MTPLAAAALAGLGFAIGSGFALHRRARELVVWVLLVACAVNFYAALYTVTSLETEPLSQKALKDIPLLLLFATAVMVNRSSEGLRSFKRALWIWGLVFAGILFLWGGDLFGIAATARYYIAYPLAAVAVSRLGLNESETRGALKLLAFLGVAEALIALAELWGLGTTFYAGYVHLVGRTLPRAIGTLGNPNNLGIFLALTAIVFVVALQRRVWITGDGLGWGCSSCLLGWGHRFRGGRSHPSRWRSSWSRGNALEGAARRCRSSPWRPFW